MMKLGGLYIQCFRLWLVTVLKLGCINQSFHRICICLYSEKTIELRSGGLYDILKVVRCWTSSRGSRVMCCDRGVQEKLVRWSWLEVRCLFRDARRRRKRGRSRYSPPWNSGTECKTRIRQFLFSASRFSFFFLFDFILFIYLFCWWWWLWRWRIEEEGEKKIEKERKEWEFFSRLVGLR